MNLLSGPDLPEGAYYFRSCAAKISPFEFILVGGYGPISPPAPQQAPVKTVHKYNVRTKQWTKMPDLTRPREFHACTFYPEATKPYVIVAGGRDSGK